jgi:N-hydroxyarylamine O-acetyltransferase
MSRRAARAQSPAMDDFDLDAYLRRIGLRGLGHAVDFETLASLVAAHRSAIAFENIDALAGRVPALDVAGLQAKLVARRRGGLCFEQNHLLRTALERLGFAVEGLEGRVRIGALGESQVTARTHMALRVTLDGVPWLVDVGFGGLAPAGPLAFGASEVQKRHGQPYRLLDAGERPGGNTGRWLLQGMTEGQWHDFYRLHDAPANPIDYKMGNWFVSTCPDVMLKANLVVSRPLPDGTRIALLNERLTTRHGPLGAPARRHLASRAEFADALADLFGLDIDGADLDALLRVVERNRPPVTMTGLS